MKQVPAQAVLSRALVAHLLLLLLCAADVGVGAQQDVLQLRFLLVDVLDGFAPAGTGVSSV